MSRVVFEEGVGPAPGLQPGEYLECMECRETVGLAEAPYLDIRGNGAECPSCEEWKGFVRRRARPEFSVARRWPPGVLESGYIAIPKLLRRHRKELGITTAQLVVLETLEGWRTESDEGVYPKAATVGLAVGMEESTVRRHVQKLVDIGLLEKEERRRGDGTFTTCR